MRRSLFLLLGLAACAPRVEVPNVSSYGEAPSLRPSEDEVELLASVDAALGRAGLPPARRDEALLAATRARCARMAKTGGKVPGALQVAQALHAAGIADERYAYVDRSVGYGTRYLDDATLDGLVEALKGEPGQPIAAACRVDDGPQSKRYFGVTLLARQVTFEPFPREAAVGAQVQLRGTVAPPVAGAELLLLSPSGKLTVVPVDAAGGFAATVAAEEGRTVVELVAPQSGYLRRLASAAIQGGQRTMRLPHGEQPLPPEAFPPGSGAIEAGSGGEVAAGLSAALGELQARLGQQPAAVGEKERAFALLESAARAKGKETDTTAAAFDARRKAAGIDGDFDVVAGRIATSDVKLLAAMLAQSPSLARALSRTGPRLGVGVTRVPRTEEFEYAIVVAGGR